MKMNKEDFMYESVEITSKGPKKTVRKVSIKNGKGIKSVSHFVRGKHVGTSKKIIDDTHVPLIKGGTFIPGLFTDCKCDSNSNKTRKRKHKKTHKRN
jgi:hypothetical protein